jgi:hypothetical protein
VVDVAVVEIRSYQLQPGSVAEFRRLFVEEAAPMLARWDVDVVAFGPSVDHEDSFVLIRRYESVEELRRSQDAFYGSDEWRQGPREAILALIESYVSVVLSAESLGASRLVS